MSSKAKQTDIITIPRGYRVKDILINGQTTTALVPKGKGAKKFKMSKSKRDKLSAAAKKMKVPLLLVGANALPVASFLTSLKRFAANKNFAFIWNRSGAYYIPVTLKQDSLGGFEIDSALGWDEVKKVGPTWLANAAAVWFPRTSWGKSLNTKIQKTRLPITL